MLRIKNKKKLIRGIVAIVLALAIIIGVLKLTVSGIVSIFAEQEENIDNINNNENTQVPNNEISSSSGAEGQPNNEVTQSPSDGNTTQKPDDENTKKPSEEPKEDTTEISGKVDGSAVKEWNLKLVNNDNAITRDYVPELAEIADGIMFDKRAISYLKNMINAMYKDKVTGIWVASGYRSYDKQEELFNKKVNYYKNQGKSQEEAQKLAQEVVQIPGKSDHNLGLAVDFNTVSNEFEKTKAFAWLQKNAGDYGFVLRYPKDKQDITKVTYESWHWRYVGKEHAKVMKEKGYCLEEYIEYLQGTQEV